MSNSTELLDCKKVIVIGGSSGIGRSVAAASLAHNASVVIASSSQDRVNAAVEALSQGIPGESDISVKGHAFDLQDFNALKTFLSQEGPFDHLVITAGKIPENRNFPAQEIGEDIRGHFESLKYSLDTKRPKYRYWAVIIAAQHIHKNHLINLGGSITLTISSVHGQPLPGWGLVSGVVGAVESSTRSLALDLKPIRVNAIAPGVVDTELFAKFSVEDRESFFKSYQQKLPVGHVGLPDELAEAYLFAMKCTYLTGQVITVDGGGALV